MVRGPGWNRWKGLGWWGVCELGPGWVVGAREVGVDQREIVSW